MATHKPPVYNPIEESRDLGFGSVISQQHGLRLLNRDGSFNVRLNTRNPLRELASYTGLLSIPWPHFFAIIIAFYLAINVCFACAYATLGAQALQGGDGSTFSRAFFFSVETFSTIGYGNIAPVGLAANILVMLEALVGLLSFAVATGLVFSRFARPHAEIIYSERAVVAPYRGINAFEFRIINARDSQLIEVHANVILSRFEQRDGMVKRQYYPLALERDRVTFFPMAWTVVHPIDDTSPLYGWDEARFDAAQSEFLVLLTAIDETFSQTVHSRSSYGSAEVIWGARFAPIFQNDAAAKALRVDLDRFHAIERAPLALSE